MAGCMLPCACLPACSKAEKEVELVAQDNERMFRQVGTPSRHAPLRLYGRVALIEICKTAETHMDMGTIHTVKHSARPWPRPPPCLPACSSTLCARG